MLRRDRGAQRGQYNHNKRHNNPVYREFFKLDDYPFRLTADARCLFLSDSHARAKAYLDYLLHARDSIAVLTGETGTGKSTVVENVVAGLGADVVVARIHQTQLDALEFLEAVALEFGLRPKGPRKSALLYAINEFLVTRHFRRQQTLLVVDEAQHLSEAVVEEIRMLADAQVAGRQALNVALLGQPDLERHMESLSRDMLAQRVRLHCRIEPLSQHDTCRYIEHRMWAAGDNGRTPFPAAALDLIYEYTGGVPRLINILCDMTLLAAFQSHTRLVGADAVRKALATLRWQPYTARRALAEGAAANADLRLPAHRARLELICEGTPVGEIWLTRERVLIGRRADQDLCIDDVRASRAHAQIVELSGEHYLYDLDSTNGTRVNSRPVRVHALRDGDVICIGAHELHYVNPAQRREEINDALAPLPAPRVAGVEV